MRSEWLENVERTLTSKLIGQPRAIRNAIRALQLQRAGLNPPKRPIYSTLLMGPTGSGKTWFVELLAQAIHGDASKLIKVDCSEFTHDHEVSKLLGAPPGYVSSDVESRISQANLTAVQSEKAAISIVLFDEIEKAHDDLPRLLLGMLDRAVLTTGRNQTINFSQCLIFFSSNLGARAIHETLQGGIGFLKGGIAIEDAGQKIYQIAKEAAKKHFLPEFLNRLDSTIVFHPLTEDVCKRIVSMELEKLRLTLAGRGILLQWTQNVEALLLKEGFDIKYGARPLKRALVRFMSLPLAEMIESGELVTGDRIRGFVTGSEVEFEKVLGLGVC